MPLHRWGLSAGLEDGTIIRFPQGNRASHVETAIRLQEEAVRLLADGGPALAARRGRARHNLAVMFSQRPTGLRSQNVDRAVRSLQAALEDRPAESDPVGRARTLRALAVLYPEWMGADTLAHAQDLSDAAAAEAALIEQGDHVARARSTGWSYLERQQSALNVDLDDLYTIDGERAVEHLNQVIANHVQALSVLPRESMPFRWAEWQAGLGRLLGRGPSLGDRTHVAQAHECFAQALAVFAPRERPLLGRQILARWGEFSHEEGDFARSLDAYRRALELSDLILESTADPSHRLFEIKESRGFGLFASYAAARLGSPDDALVLAERERMRLQGPLFHAREALSRPGAHRTEILAALEKVQQLVVRLVIGW